VFGDPPEEKLALFAKGAMKYVPREGEGGGDFGGVALTKAADFFAAGRRANQFSQGGGE